MYENGYASLFAQALGKAYMVGMGVGQHNGLQVGNGMADLRQALPKNAVMPRKAGVYQGKASALPDHVPIKGAGIKPEYIRCNFHV